MDSDPAMTLIQHETFYLPFGDLVLQSVPGDDNTSTLFRVNKSILAFNSPVFAGMFTLPDSSEREAHDGVPLVLLHDSAEEIAALCAALHDPRYLSLPRFDADLPVRLTPVMKIATKYEVESVRERVIALMHDSWPRTFEQWLRVQFELSVIENENQGGLVDGKAVRERIPEPCAAIRFAQDYDVPSILPAAFYRLSGISANHDWEDPWRERARWGLLEASDLRRLARLKEYLALQTKGYLELCGEGQLLMRRAAGDPCSRVDECSQGFKTVVEQWQNLSEIRDNMELFTPKPLDALQDLFVTWPSWRRDLCQSCHGHLGDIIREKQRSLWHYIEATLAT